MSKQIVTNRRNRRKTTATMQRTGTVPTIIQVRPGEIGSENEMTITFDSAVIIRQVPQWETLGLAENVTAVSIVSNDGTTLVLDFGVDTTTATGLRVPQGNNYAMSASGKPVPPGDYMV